MTFMLRKRGWQAPRGSIVLTTVRLIAGLALPAVGCDSSTESEVSIRVGGLSESSVLTSSPAAVDFGWLLPDATLVRRSVTIANIGTVRAMLGAPRFVGTSNGSFSVQQTACWGVSLEPGGSCVTTLAFHPAQAPA